MTIVSVNTLKLELVDTNAYKRQPSLSERVIVDGHICHTALHFGVKAKETKTKFLRFTGYLHSIKPPIKQDLFLILVLVRQELSKLLTACLTAVKKHVSSTVKRYMRDPVKTLFWSIKNSGEILDKLKARDINATTLSTYNLLLFTLLYLII